MKRIFLLFLCLMLLPVWGLADDTPRYRAVTSKGFHLRETPGGLKLWEVPMGGHVSILEWDEEWCFIKYKHLKGYAKTEWLYSLRSVDAMAYPLPNMPVDITGRVVFREAVLIQGGEFEGLTAQPEQFACVSAAEDDTLTLPVWRGEMALVSETVEYIPFAAWESAQPGNVIGGFTTFYGLQLGKELPAEREFNILLGAERIEGCVIPAGGSFSFNEFCAPYTKSNGYQKAPNISKDGTGYGGGVCQLTTTLYNALLTLPLQIEEWSIHRYKGVDYVPQFFDAAVGSYSDLVFQNTLPYPISLHTYPQDGMLTVLICRADDTAN
ncbi:MAG: VanW family protein [Clostridia bacterium]|nr:VanW family protein [Clostridia bacterium]